MYQLVTRNHLQCLKCIHFYWSKRQWQTSATLISYEIVTLDFRNIFTKGILRKTYDGLCKTFWIFFGCLFWDLGELLIFGRHFFLHSYVGNDRRKQYGFIIIQRRRFSFLQIRSIDGKMHAIIRFVINYSISKTYYIKYYLSLNCLKNPIAHIENWRRVYTSENVKKNLKVLPNAERGIALVEWIWNIVIQFHQITKRIRFQVASGKLSSKIPKLK